VGVIHPQLDISSFLWNERYVFPEVGVTSKHAQIAVAIRPRGLNSVRHTLHQLVKRMGLSPKEGQ
jgi:hypothetical protein